MWVGARKRARGVRQLGKQENTGKRNARDQKREKKIDKLGITQKRLKCVHMLFVTTFLTFIFHQ